MYSVTMKFYQAVAKKKRMLTIFITTLTVFAVLYLRTLLGLHHERRELSQTKFLYLACKDNLKVLKSKSSSKVIEDTFGNQPSLLNLQYLKSPRLRSILESINANETAQVKRMSDVILEQFYRTVTGTKTITGLHNIKALKSSKFILPHFEKHKNGLRPAFHLSGGRNMVDVVIGVTSVKRHNATYLMETLNELVEGLSEYEKNSTLIVVMIGEVDIEYVLRTAISIEKRFTQDVNSGLIEVISPLKSYYPNKDILPVTRDSVKRTLWRTKHVLDCIYVMAYGHTKGSYYLIMEDDIVTEKGYMKVIKQLIEHTTHIKPYWTIIDFCNRFNGIGKLMKSSDVDHFIKYLQLFYRSMPLDYLIESYLRDLACNISKYQKSCKAAVNEIKGKISVSLFKHVGLYSSLKGKIQLVEDFRGSTVPNFYPHNNPPLKYIHCSIKSTENRRIEMAYEGATYFLGPEATEGDFIEFYFREPIVLKRYKFRSGNYAHKTFLMNKAIVEVQQSYSKTFTPVGTFDEFGYVEGNVGYLGELAAIRLRMTNVKKKPIVLSEIELVPENSSQPNV